MPKSYKYCNFPGYPCTCTYKISVDFHSFSKYTSTFKYTLETVMFGSSWRFLNCGAVFHTVTSNITSLMKLSSSNSKRGQKIKDVCIHKVNFEKF